MILKDLKKHEAGDTVFYRFTIEVNAARELDADCQNNGEGGDK